MDVEYCGTWLFAGKFAGGPPLPQSASAPTRDCGSYSDAEIQPVGAAARGKVSCPCQATPLALMRQQNAIAVCFLVGT